MIKKEAFVLDACALIAFLRDEAGGDIIRDIFKQSSNGEIDLAINKINLLEVYYGFYRTRGKKYANGFLVDLGNYEITLREFTDEILLEAGRLKATYKISLADSIALAQAITLDASLLTSDRHEFEIIENGGGEKIKFIWIR